MSRIAVGNLHCVESVELAIENAGAVATGLGHTLEVGSYPANDSSQWGHGDDGYVLQGQKNHHGSLRAHKALLQGSPHGLVVSIHRSFLEIVSNLSYALLWFNNTPSDLIIFNGFK